MAAGLTGHEGSIRVYETTAGHSGGSVHASGYGSTAVAIAGPRTRLTDGMAMQGDGGIVHAAYASRQTRDAAVIVSRGANLSRGVSAEGSGGIVYTDRVRLGLRSESAAANGQASAQGGLISVQRAGLQVDDSALSHGGAQ